MSQTKLYFQIEKNSNEVTKNILSKDDLNLCKFNIYQLHKNMGIKLTKLLKIIIDRTSKILLIKKINGWSKFHRSKKICNWQKIKKNKINLIKYCQNNNISTIKYSYEFVHLKIYKYISDSFVIANPHNNSPLIDAYEEYENKIFHNISPFIYFIHLFNSKEENSQNNNDIQINNYNPIIIYVKEEDNIIFPEENLNPFVEVMNEFVEQYANLFIEDVNEFADKYKNSFTDNGFELVTQNENSFEEDVDIFKNQFVNSFFRDINEYADQYENNYET